MRTNIADILWHYPSSYIEEYQLAHLLGGTPDSQMALIYRAVKKGWLTRVKRGLYCLGERLSVKAPHPFEAAQFIYGPSYVSLESALAYHNLIPEAVHTITSVSIKRSKQFTTPLGVFAFYCLPIDNFFIGVDHVEQNAYHFLIASPWKALLDYVYCYKKDAYPFSAIEGSLRIEVDSLPKITRKTLEQLSQFYTKRRIDFFIKSIPKELIDEC